MALAGVPVRAQSLVQSVSVCVINISQSKSVSQRVGASRTCLVQTQTSRERPLALRRSHTRCVSHTSHSGAHRETTHNHTGREYMVQLSRRRGAHQEDGRVSRLCHRSRECNSWPPPREEGRMQKGWNARVRVRLSVWSVEGRGTGRGAPRGKRGARRAAPLSI